MSSTGDSVHCSSCPSALPTLPRAWHAQRLHSYSLAQTVQQGKAGCGCATDIAVAVHAQPAARLLVELRAHERQCRGKTLHGRCARLRACSIHLGKECPISKARHAVPHACRVSQAHHVMPHADHIRGTEQLTLCLGRNKSCESMLLQCSKAAQSRDPRTCSAMSPRSCASAAT